jgi:hypothetical protein
MSRVVKRSASQAIKSGLSRRGVPLSAIHSSQSFPSGREATIGASVAARDKLDGYRMVARIEWSGATPNSHRARLDRQVPKRHSRAREPEREDRLSPW